jgi:hypothetical protein
LALASIIIQKLKHQKYLNFDVGLTNKVRRMALTCYREEKASARNQVEGGLTCYREEEDSARNQDEHNQQVQDGEPSVASSCSTQYLAGH